MIKNNTDIVALDNIFPIRKVKKALQFAKRMKFSVNYQNSTQDCARNKATLL
ncbi:hypothetical protein [uncultured Gammaproteobacteria bacterium]|nr:hypothetical protein [uncultured Gammaproteobacteria bacterium]CAC9595142.1 hypothetical protein [uncultured Gammaproteobacteria bacterium]